MLHGIDPLLTADLLHALRAMGHGDSISLVDANFPATSCARRLITLPALDIDRVFEAVLSVLPVDDFIPLPLLTMQVVGAPQEVPEAVAQIRQIAQDNGVSADRLGTISREAFYDQARASYCIVQTGDRRLYANVIITKGVIRL
ncbi:RbsD/FucU family protein [Acidocella facilis]|uniref:RbsD/FucU family protein n=1 Tax=Acidocella facilis TaxID=525 RepID=UPI0004796229|nr:RbsD/FucU domain-containing protein [Acidocella facilis]